jgi:hypothetical protein
MLVICPWCYTGRALSEVRLGVGGEASKAGEEIKGTRIDPGQNVVVAGGR